jgi:hypothetical protein
MVGVNKEGTGARAFAGAEYVAAGKTGTAQVFSLKGAEYKTGKLARPTCATTPCSSPSRRPTSRRSRWPCWSRTAASAPRPAAPIARQVLDYYLLGKRPKAPAPGTRMPSKETRMNPGIGLSPARMVAEAGRAARSAADADRRLLVLLAIGIMASASPERINAQLINVAVALVVMRVVAQVPPQRLMHLAVPIYVAGVLLLVAWPCSATCPRARGAGSTSASCASSPRRLMKIAMPLLLAWYFQKREAMPRLRDYGSPPSCCCCRWASSRASPTSAPRSWCWPPAST